jgi:hypothetical protein
MKSKFTQLKSFSLAETNTITSFFHPVLFLLNITMLNKILKLRVFKFLSFSVAIIFAGVFSPFARVYAEVEGIPFNPDFPKAQYPYAQDLDGCSGLSNPKQVRDTWGPVNFTEACNQHDRCYYTVGSNWNTCNERLYSDLRAACERDLRTSTSIPDPLFPWKTWRVDLPPNPISLNSCYVIATSYYGGVQAGVALDVFKDAQDKQRRYEQWVASITIPNGRKFVKLRNKNWGRCLNMQSTQNQNGGLPNVWECVSHPDQEWKIEDAGNGFVKLRNKNWGRCLNMQSTQNQNGGLPNVWECVSHPDQEWKIEDA